MKETRREFMKWALGSSTMALTGCSINNPVPTGDLPRPNQSLPYPSFANTPDTENTILPVTSFENKDTEEVAKKHSIKPGYFFLFPNESNPLWQQITAFQSDELYPIYPPAVLTETNRRLIYSLADKHKHSGVTPTMIATIMTIESAGNPTAESKAGAEGLFQVMPGNFDESIRNNPQAMQDIHTNGEAAINFFANYCLPNARDSLKNYPQNHPLVIGRAFMAYNAGYPGAIIDYKNAEVQTQREGDFAIRYLMTAELAAGLRQKGYSDSQIVRALSSPEIDARAAALLALPTDDNDVLEQLQYDVVGIDDKTHLISDLGKRVREEYLNYKKNPYAKRPASPALRIWLSTGGLSLFNQMDINNSDAGWQNLTSSRPIQ